MRPDLFQSFIDAISTLTKSQKQILDETLLQTDLVSDTPKLGGEILSTGSSISVEPLNLEQQIEKQFAEHPSCPYCHNDGNIKRWGKRKGRQRYSCSGCNSTFSAFTKTPLSGLRHPEKWGSYLIGMPESQTLRNAAKSCNIDLKTSFRWRHRFLEVIENDQADVLQGIVELDETLLNESFKGQRAGLPRPARKRGNDKNKARKVPVLVARDRDYHTVDGRLKDESADSLCFHLNGRIDIEATVCADAHLAHEKLAETLGFEFKELVTSAGQHVKDGIYHIQHVNAYHSHLKRWIGGKFHGVATKYLTHYLGWKRKLAEKCELTYSGLASQITSHWSHQPSTVT